MYQAVFFVNLSVTPSSWISSDAPVIDFRFACCHKLPHVQAASISSGHIVQQDEDGVSQTSSLSCRGGDTGKC